jgi:hypothetical protein
MVVISSGEEWTMSVIAQGPRAGPSFFEGARSA